MCLCGCRQQDAWSREQVKLNQSTDPLWRHTGFILAQLDGLQAGVAHWAKQHRQQVPPPHHVVLCYMVALASLLDCLSHILWFMKKYATVK